MTSKLWLLTVCNKITAEMKYNYELLKRNNIDVRLCYYISMFKKGDNSDKPDYEEIRARNAALNKIPVGEAFLIVDSDELIVGNVNYLAKTIDTMKKRNITHADVAFFESDLTIVSRPRLIIKTEGMEYRKKHYKLYSNGINLFRKHQKETYAVHSIAIIHTKPRRCDVLIERRIDFNV